MAEAASSEGTPIAANTELGSHLARRTSRTSADRDTSEIEVDELGVMADAGKHEAGRIGKARGASTDDPGFRYKRHDLRFEAIAERSDAFFEAVVLQRQSGRCAETDDTSDILRACTETLLLGTALQQRQRLHPFAQNESTDALRAAKLMRGQAECIGAKFKNIDRDLACGLHRIDMQPHTSFAGKLGDRLHRLNNPRLIIRQHGGERRRAVLFEIVL